MTCYESWSDDKSFSVHSIKLTFSYSGLFGKPKLKWKFASNVWICESNKMPLWKKGLSLKRMKGQIPPSSLSFLVEETFSRYLFLRHEIDEEDCVVVKITKFSLTKKWEFSETNYQSLKWGNFFCKKPKQITNFKGEPYFKVLDRVKWGSRSLVLVMDIVFDLGGKREESEHYHEKCYDPYCSTQNNLEIGSLVDVYQLSWSKACLQTFKIVNRRHAQLFFLAFSGIALLLSACL